MRNFKVETKVKSHPNEEVIISSLLSNKGKINSPLLSFLIALCLLLSNTTTFAQKINGMSFSGPNDPVLEVSMLESIKISNANWVALIPEATLNRFTLALEEDEKSWSETSAGITQSILFAKQAGFKIFLKPHIILSKLKKKSRLSANEIAKYKGTNKKLKDKTKGAEWRGDFNAKNEADWKLLEEDYEKYILNLAKIAAKYEVDLFSVGTELKQFAIKRPEFWVNLIYQVKSIYKGALTYSANWDEYQKISFWQELDYIGIDAYFPVNRMKTPTVKKTLKNWRPILKQLKKLSKKQKRKILLTEFGYRNVSFAGKRPWTHDVKGKQAPNNIAQYNLYQAFFQALWKKSWIEGGFAWKWFYKEKKEGNTTFSVQGKPALSVIQHWYKTYSK